MSFTKFVTKRFLPWIKLLVFLACSAVYFSLMVIITKLHTVEEENAPSLQLPTLPNDEETNIMTGFVIVLIICFVVQTTIP